MSVDTNMIFLADAADFDFGKAEFIALEVAMGASVAELHELHSDRIPSPIVVNRWRERYPAFDLLMLEAERAKAEKLADETVRIADDEDRHAAQAANGIKSRQWLAAKLSERFGSTARGGGEVHIHNTVNLTDEQLLQIAGSAYIEGESEVVGIEGPGVVVDEGGSSAEGPVVQDRRVRRTLEEILK